MKDGARYRAKAAVIAAYGGRCVCCLEATPEFLTIDHIAGGGSVHRRALRRPGGHLFYVWLRHQGFPKGFRLLCFNCNSARGFWGYCPHERASPHAAAAILYAASKTG